MIKILTICLLTIGFILMLNIHNDNRNLRNVATTYTSTNHNAITTDAYMHPKKIYGHIHMAKTGGSSLNGILANTYERVCGTKGYSYDAYQANVRWTAPKTYVHPSWGRDRVPPEIMDEIGYDDCDYISNELRFKFWSRFNDFHDTPMELHLPCRDPVDHWMSQCNHRRKEINCDGTEAEFFESVHRCHLMIKERFDLEMALQNKASLKCYEFKKQFTVYMEYMAKKLQRRRIVSTYKRRETNPPRNRDNECIWKRKDLMKKLEYYLLDKYDYYKFCSQCLGSKNDITHAQVQGDHY